MRFLPNVFALLLAAPMPYAAAAAAPVFPGASGVGLEPPPGMHVATGFNGFQEGPASIIISELPKEAFAAIDAQRSMFVTRFGATTAEDIDVNGVRGFSVNGLQPLGGKPFRKWIVVLDGANETALVTAQVPVGDNDVSDDAVGAALKSIAFRTRPDLAAQVAALPFTVGDLAGFRASSTALGAALILVDGPEDVDANQTQAHAVVATNAGDIPAPDARVDFAKAKMQAFQAVRTTEIASAKQFDADGATWVQVDAKGSEGQNETPVAITFFVRFGKASYITVVCIAPRSDAAKDADRFKKLALSVKPKG